MNHLEDEGNAKQANGCGNVIGMLERQVEMAMKALSQDPK